MEDMNNFNEADHPRGGNPGNPGQFSAKTHKEAECGLDGDIQPGEVARDRAELVDQIVQKIPDFDDGYFEPDENIEDIYGHVSRFYNKHENDIDEIGCDDNGWVFIRVGTDVICLTDEYDKDEEDNPRRTGVTYTTHTPEREIESVQDLTDITYDRYEPAVDGWEAGTPEWESSMSEATLESWFEGATRRRNNLANLPAVALPENFTERIDRDEVTDGFLKTIQEDDDTVSPDLPTTRFEAEKEWSTWVKNNEETAMKMLKDSENEDSKIFGTKLPAIVDAYRWG